MQTFLLDLFASIALVSATLCIVSTNPIHSVVFLILVFCNASGLLLTLTSKIEFLAIMFLIIYVGAIAVLFLFVVMMLNVKVANENWLRYFLAIGGIIAAAFFLEIFFEGFSPSTTPILSSLSWTNSLQNENFILPVLTNIESLGSLIYTYYFYYFLMASLILLVAMIGAIILTMHKRRNASKKQFIFEQVSRNFEQSICFAS